MQFSDTTNKNGIIQDCEMLLAFADGGISGNSTLLKQFTSLINRGYDKVVGTILESSVEWQWDDSNYTNFPIATKDLVANQRDYKLPAATDSADISTFLKLIRIEVKNPAGQYVTVKNMVENPVTDIGLTSLYSSTGLPEYYRLVADSVELYPSPSSATATLSAGLKIYFQRSQSDFVSTDTTKQPGFPSIYHRLLSLEASLVYAATRGMKQAGFIQTEKNELMAKLGLTIANKNKDFKIGLRTRTSDYE